MGVDQEVCFFAPRLIFPVLPCLEGMIWMLFSHQF